MAKCSVCGETLGIFGNRDGRCDYCRDRESKRAEDEVIAHARAAQVASETIPTTTAMSMPGWAIYEALGIVAGETVAGINALKEVAVIVRDTVGGRSETLQSAIRSARETSINEMRMEAYKLGADAVIGVHITYGEAPSGRPGSMLLVVATGTAIRRQ